MPLVFLILTLFFSSCSKNNTMQDIPLYQSLVLLNISCYLPFEEIEKKIEELSLQYNIPLKYVIDDKKDHYILFHNYYVVFKNYHLCQSQLICPPYMAFRGLNEDLTPICDQKPFHPDMIEDVEFCDKDILRGFPRLSISDLYVGCFERPSQNCYSCSCGKITNKYCSSSCPKGTLFVSKDRETGISSCFEYEERPQSWQSCEVASLKISYPQITDLGDVEWPCKDQYPEPKKPLPFIEVKKVLENEEK